MRRHPAWNCLIGLVALVGCGDDGGSYVTATDGGLTTGPTSAGGTDTPTSGATTGGEVEDEGDFRVPKASGKYVYSASKMTDSVAVINTATLVIDVVGVGQGPTVVEPIPGQGGDAGGVVVLDQGSDDVALLRTTDAGVTTLALFKVTPGANNLAVSPDGQYVFVYHDVDGAEELGPGSDQELTVLELASGMAHAMTVGAHPREVVFSTDHTRAWVITAAGVNVIPFDSLGMIGKPPLLPVVDDPGIDPATLEVQVAASEGVALARVSGESWVAVTDLGTGDLTQIDLPGSPTDLDIAPGGGFAVLTLPSVDGSTFVELPLPLQQGGTYKEHLVEGEYVGQSAVARSGDAMLLFTTVNPFALGRGVPTDLAAGSDPAFAGSSSGSSGSSGGSSGSSTSGSSTGGTGSTGGDAGTSTGGDPEPPPGDPRQRITLARRAGPAWDMVTLFVEVPVVSVGLAPDSRSAVLVHDNTQGQNVVPWSYSLFDLTPEFPLIKRQTVQARPGSVLFTPDGGRAAVLLRDDPMDIRKVDLVDLGNFIVTPLALGSPPEGAGYVDATQKIYVSQEHPTGRITFVSPTNAVQTVTGYVLNDSVKD